MKAPLSAGAETDMVMKGRTYLWADNPECAFLGRTSAAIIVWLAFLIAINLADVLLRRKFERRW